MNYQEAIEYLYNRLPVFHHIGGAAYKPGLENTIRMMGKLDNPHQHYKTIHVAGTNGKGSVSHFLAAILQKAGFKVGLYTSPHLVDFSERIRIDGKTIDKQYVTNFVEKHTTTFAEIEPSFFEATMAMAFKYFSDNQIDIAVIEVGLGGRLDSTNIIQPLLSVITNISFDHTGFLGNSLPEIAAEKAGIIKKGVPVVIGETHPETKPVFLQKAAEQSNHITFADQQYNFTYKSDYKGKTIITNTKNDEYLVGLNGLYQLKNVGTALASIEQLKNLGLKIQQEAIYNGLSNVIEITGLQGRWQQLQQSPTVICDTGHNKGGIEWVVKQLNSQYFNTLRIVIGMVNDKDIDGVLELLPQKAIYYFTQASINRALSAEILQKQAAEHKLYGKCYLTVENALKAALDDSSSEDLIFIGGSNFIVGEAIPFFEQ